MNVYTFSDEGERANIFNSTRKLSDWFYLRYKHLIGLQLLLLEQNP